MFSLKIERGAYSKDSLKQRQNRGDAQSGRYHYSRWSLVVTGMKRFRGEDGTGRGNEVKVRCRHVRQVYVFMVIHAKPPIVQGKPTGISVVIVRESSQTTANGPRPCELLMGFLRVVGGRDF